MVKQRDSRSVEELIKKIPEYKGEPWHLPDKSKEEMRVDRVLPGVNKNDRKQ